MDDDAIVTGFGAQQRERRLSRDTIVNYRRTHDRLVAWLHARGLTLLTVDESALRAFLDEPRSDGEPLHAVSRNHYLTRIALLFGYIADEGLRADVPTRRIRRARVPRALPRPIPTPDLHRALELADDRIGFMLALAAYAGLRRGEIAGLLADDFRVGGDRPAVLVRGKGRRERLVPLSPVVTARAARYGLPASGPVFLGLRGPISRDTVGKLVSGHLRACGIDATTHQGRHTFATALYRSSGHDLRVTQEVLGHASPATTAVYAAFDQDLAGAAVDAIPAPDAA